MPAGVQLVAWEWMHLDLLQLRNYDVLQAVATSTCLWARAWCTLHAMSSCFVCQAISKKQFCSAPRADRSSYAGNLVNFPSSLGLVVKQCNDEGLRTSS